MAAAGALIAAPSTGAAKQFSDLLPIRARPFTNTTITWTAGTTPVAAASVQRARLAPSPTPQTAKRFGVDHPVKTRFPYRRPSAACLRHATSM